jgi:hypothetical protein
MGRHTVMKVVSQSLLFDFRAPPRGEYPHHIEGFRYYAHLVFNRHEVPWPLVDIPHFELRGG